MHKTPLALDTSDFWKLNDLIDALYVIVDCHLRAKMVLSRFVLELGDAISGISRVPSQAARSIG